MEPENNRGDALADEAARMASSTKQQAKTLLKEGAGQARATANSVVDQAATDAGQQLGTTAQAVRESLAPLRERQPQLASLADKSISHLEQAAGRLEQQDLDSVIDSATALARSRPEIFIGAAALVGIALGRFIQLAADQE